MKYNIEKENYTNIRWIPLEYKYCLLLPAFSLLFNDRELYIYRLISHYIPNSNLRSSLLNQLIILII